MLYFYSFIYLFIIIIFFLDLDDDDDDGDVILYGVHILSCMYELTAMIDRGFATGTLVSATPLVDGVSLNTSNT